MLQRLEEETHTNKYIVTEKMPKEMAQQRKILLNLQKVVAEPAMGQSDLDKLHEQVQHHMAVHHSTWQYTTVHRSTPQNITHIELLLQHITLNTIHCYHFSLHCITPHVALLLHCPFFFFFKELGIIDCFFEHCCFVSNAAKLDIWIAILRREINWNFHF